MSRKGITQKQFLAIKRDLKASWEWHSIARRNNVAISTVKAVKSRKSWADWQEWRAVRTQNESERARNHRALERVVRDERARPVPPVEPGYPWDAVDFSFPPIERVTLRQRIAGWFKRG